MLVLLFFWLWLFFDRTQTCFSLLSSLSNSFFFMATSLSAIQFISVPEICCNIFVVRSSIDIYTSCIYQNAECETIELYSTPCQTIRNWDGTQRNDIIDMKVSSHMKKKHDTATITNATFLIVPFSNVHTRSRKKIFQSRIYLTDGVANGKWDVWRGMRGGMTVK